jgi:hypothetical protein
MLPPCNFFASLGANMAKKALEVVNSSGLTDADWIEINKVRRAYERGGWDAFWSELETLGDDLIVKIKVVGAFFPDAIREAIEDELAESGLALEDLREFLKKNEALATEH